MRIIQITPRYLPFYGGVEIHVKYISEWLARMHEVVVLTCDPVGGLPREEIINGVFVRRFRGFAPGEAYYFSPEMALEIKRAHPDILHAHNYHAFPFFASALGTSKLVVTPHYHGRGHTWLRNILLGGFRPIGKVVFGKADKILYLSSHERRLLKEHFGIGDSKLYFLPNGVDPSELRNPKTKTRKQNQKTILCVSRLQKYKGIHYAIHALSHLDSRFELEIVGTGPYKKDLIRLVKETGLEERVTFYENLPRKLLLERYGEADVFVLLSSAESYGISVGEALASGIPCIVANTSALSAWADGKTCFGIDIPPNIERLAGLIREVSTAISEPVELPTWPEIGQRLNQIYQME